MKIIRNLLAMTALTMAMNTTQIFAEDTTALALQLINQKIKTLEAQIDALEAKGIEKFSDEEFLKYDELSDKLLTAQREKTAALLDRQNEMLDSLKKDLQK